MSKSRTFNQTAPIYQLLDESQIKLELTLEISKLGEGGLDRRQFPHISKIGENFEKGKGKNIFFQS